MKSPILEVLQSLANDSSRLAKEAILRNLKPNSDFWDVAKLALDPFISFYIKKIPAHTKSDNGELSLTEGLDLLSRLSSRELTGNAGIDHLVFILENVSAEDSLVIERVIAKDLKCGVSEATINKIRPNLIPTYPCMLASGFDVKLVEKVKFPALCQLKLDGMRFNAIIRDKNTIELRTRNGREVILPEGRGSSLLLDAFSRLAAKYDHDIVFDGELLVVDQAGNPLDRKTGNGILNKAVKGTLSDAEAQMIRATLWDAIPLKNFYRGVYPVPYGNRFGLLSSALAVAKGQAATGHLIDLVHTVSVNNDYEAQSEFRKWLEKGQEGTILKTLDSIWENKRSKHHIKFKGELEADLVIVDLERGTGKNAGRLGALVCESADGVIKVNVGSGYSDNQRTALWAQGHDLVGRVVTVKYNARIKDKSSKQESLFLPIFVEVRLDKNTANHSKEIQ
ncbi:MAG: hypothetical protein ACO4CS_12310 [bacterium]